MGGKGGAVEVAKEEVVVVAKVGVEVEVAKVLGVALQRAAVAVA